MWQQLVQVPVPLRSTVCGLDGLKSSMLKVPVRGPMAVGWKATLIVQDELAGSLSMAREQGLRAGICVVSLSSLRSVEDLDVGLDRLVQRIGDVDHVGRDGHWRI